jgi:uncharacterized protein involved in outer membrane biogenesis
MKKAKNSNLMKWLKWGGLALGAIVLILAVIPFFISLDDYIPRIEREISARILEPVKISGLRAGGLPLPHVTVSGITVGKADDIQVGRVTVTPDLLSLLGTTKVIRSVEIEELVMTQKAMDKLSALAAPGGAKPQAAAEPQTIRVESIRLDGAVLKLQKAAFGPFDARLRLDDRGNLESAVLATRDGKLKARVKPEDGRYLIDASARDWRLPVGATILFDELTVKGIATQQDASFSEMRAKLYGGTVSGNVHLAWRKGMQMKGAAEVSQVEIGSLLQALDKPRSMSGRLTAQPQFSANARSAGQVGDVLRLDTPFDVQNGVLHGVDLSKAAVSLINKEAGKGGETRFDKLSGHLAIERGRRRLTQLNIVSGSLSASGNVTIAPNDALSGRLNANVKAVTLATGAVPLNVSGTLANPWVFPTGGTVAGAAAGTAVLGPVVGTAVGARVGQWTEGLTEGWFGKKEGEKKKEKK